MARISENGRADGGRAEQIFAFIVGGDAASGRRERILMIQERELFIPLITPWAEDLPIFVRGVQRFADTTGETVELREYREIQLVEIVQPLGHPRSRARSNGHQRGTRAGVVWDGELIWDEAEED